MIPADHITIDGDTAWWVVPADQLAASTAMIDRPCATCGGTGERHYDDAPPRLDGCPDCHGTGRHCFPIEVEQYAYGEEYTGEPVICGTTVHTLAVHVVPGMVLEIVDARTWDEDPYVAIVIDVKGKAWMFGPDDDEGDPSDPVPVTLPSAAKPGMWAVQLKVVA